MLEPLALLTQTLRTMSLRQARNEVDEAFHQQFGTTSR
jgi:hypothetical protein